MTARVFDIFDQFAMDPNKELEGAWVTIGPAQSTIDNGAGIMIPDPDSAPQIKVARANNKRYSRLLVSEYEANKTVLEMKDDNADQLNDEIMARIGAQALLMGWKNISIQGRALPDGWNIADAKAAMSINGFRALVIGHSQNVALYKVVQEDAAAKN